MAYRAQLHERVHLESAQGQNDISSPFPIGAGAGSVCHRYRHAAGFTVERLHVLDRVHAEQGFSGNAAFFRGDQQRCFCRITGGRPCALFRAAAAVAGLLFLRCIGYII